MKTVNLEEILKKELIPTVYAANPDMTFNATIRAMREACRQALELAAENAEIASGFESTGDYSGRINYYVDKETILGIINQIK